METETEEILKACTDCRLDLPLSAFSRHVAMPCGRNRRCRSCLSSYQKKVREARKLRLSRGEPARVKRKKVVPEHKECCRCGRTQEIGCYAVNRATRDGFSHHCRACQKKANAKSYAKNKNDILRKQKLRTPEGKEAARAICRRSRLKKIDYYRELGRQNSKRDRLKHIERWMLNSAKARAEQHHVPFSICREDIVVPARCPVLDIPLTIGGGAGREYSPTLDRIVPEKGYVVGNVRVISGRANRLKSDASLAELRALVAYVERNFSPGESP